MIRNDSSQGLINTDDKGYQEYKLKKKQTKSVEKIQQDLEDLKVDVSHIRGVVDHIVTIIEKIEKRDRSNVNTND